jgi:hypothetical protein
MKYNKKYAKELREGLRSDGKSEVECCILWGINYETYEAWLRENEDFAEADRIGKLHAAAWYFQKYRDIAAGKSAGNAAMMQFAMKNQEYIHWKDKPEDIEVKDEPLGVIQIEVLPQRGSHDKKDEDKPH